MDYPFLGICANLSYFSYIYKYINTKLEKFYFLTEIH